MREKIVIIGAGGHAKVVAECIDEKVYEIVGFLDKDDMCVGEQRAGISIVGNDANPQYWKEMGIQGCIMGIGHVGNSAIRNKAYKRFKDAGFHMITAIHKSSIVSKNAVIDDGVVIMPGAIVNANAHIQENAIINSNSVVEHDTIIGFGTHVAPGSTISGGVVVGENVLIGVGSSIIQARKIGDNAIVGAGAVVIKDVPEDTLVLGNPARIVRKVD